MTEHVEIPEYWRRPAKRTTKAQRRVAMTTLKTIAKDVKKIMGRVRGPRIIWAWDCPDRTVWSYQLSSEVVKGSYIQRAHTHSQGATKGTICISPSWLIGNKEGAWTHPANWDRLIIHEMTHVKMPKVDHYTSGFKLYERCVRYRLQRLRRARDETARLREREPKVQILPVSLTSEAPT